MLILRQGTKNKMEKLSVEQAKNQLNNLISMGYKYFCPECLSGLEQTEEGEFYCPNEMCSNEEREQKEV